MRSLLKRLAGWLVRKTAPAAVRFSGSDRPGFVDAFRRLRNPSAFDLLGELKNTAYACATLNAGVCASFPPRLYVSTRPGQAAARCQTRALSAGERRGLADRPELAPLLRSAERVEEVVDHPLLTLLRAVNPTHNAHDLWELTTLYQEVHGSAYWQLGFGPLGVPDAIWVLPAQHVRAVRAENSTELVDWYEVRTRRGTERLSPAEVIHFRYPDPRDPYGVGLSPLRAAFEHASMASEFVAYRRSLWANRALPGVIISPDEFIAPEERARLESAWESRFAQGGNGGVLVADERLNVETISAPLGDLAALAEAGSTKEDICNAFGIPIALLTTETNLANLQASLRQHASLSVRPRLRRRDEKINEQLIPRYDPTGRLFVASDDPTPTSPEAVLASQESDLKWGVRTINEIRAERGLPPVPWGETPWVPAGTRAGDQMGSGDRIG
jgi:HK97 family phage portal protein